MRAENSSLRQEIFELRQHQEEMTEHSWAQLPEKEVVRDSEALQRSADRILASLQLGTQAQGYKVAKRALDRFIKALGSMEQ